MQRAWAIGTVITGAAVIGSAFAVIRGNSGPVGMGAGHQQQTVASTTDTLRVTSGERAVKEYDIGNMPQGGRREVSFIVSNPGATVITIGTIRTSCDCLRVEMDANRVEAGKEVNGRVMIDLAREAGFVGGLILDAEVLSAEDGRPVFGFKLSVQVK